MTVQTTAIIGIVVKVNAPIIITFVVVVVVVVVVAMVTVWCRRGVDRRSFGQQRCGLAVVWSVHSLTTADSLLSVPCRGTFVGVLAFICAH